MVGRSSRDNRPSALLAVFIVTNLPTGLPRRIPSQPREPLAWNDHDGTMICLQLRLLVCVICFVSTHRGAV
jgi:hypothetical protein